jgi:RimJ/RimL family protein N-acetyltransferase
MIIEGQFVVLTPLTVDDAELTQRWRTSGRAFLLNKGARTVAEQAAWIRSRAKYEEHGEEYNFIQVIKATGQPVGMISLVEIDLVHRHAEPAHFLIGEPEAVRDSGVPIALEATKLIYQLAFDTLKLHRVFGPFSSENDKMLIYHKFLGMQEEGRLRDHYYLNGKWSDAVVVGLLEDEFHSTVLPRLIKMIGATHGR